MTNVITNISTTLLCYHYSDECLIFVQCYSTMNDVMSLTYNYRYYVIILISNVGIVRKT